MPSPGKPSVVRGILLAAALPIFLFGAVQLGCGSQEEMRSGSGVPASQGTVEATAADNGNTNLSIRVSHLAPPQRMASGATVYVVWVRPRDSVQQNVGALTLNDKLEGRLETVTPHSRFLVSITPESDGMVAGPTNVPVFTADVDRS